MASADNQCAVGDLVFSRTGCSGVVLYVPFELLDRSNVVIVWTIQTTDGRWRFKEQLRELNSFSRGNDGIRSPYSQR